ncbi:MAG: DUF3667 domain-containing protein [Alphaproteobacteria bacterium]|nr:DUF3667 domain-containing protein [Alphaproteobacteria bacterium]
MLLARDFAEDTFGFDSRMWRTLGLMAAKPGHVPRDYAHGRRSRYTPPVRLFLVVSFLFFLVLSLTQTMFVAFEVTPKKALPAEAEAAIEQKSAALGVEVDTFDCGLQTKLRYFVRPKDITIDEAAWKKCRESIDAAVAKGVVAPNDAQDLSPAQKAELEAKVKGGAQRVVGGLSRAIEDPVRFNAEINAWLPRITLAMTPVLAVLLLIFIRGRDALFFDHLVLSLYSHAVGFAVVGGAIIAAQLGAPDAGLVAFGVLTLYFVLALRRAYRRGWVKTVLSSLAIEFIYLVILSSAVLAIVIEAVWKSGAS